MGHKAPEKTGDPENQSQTGLCLAVWLSVPVCHHWDGLLIFFFFNMQDKRTGPIQKLLYDSSQTFSKALRSNKRYLDHGLKLMRSSNINIPSDMSVTFLAITLYDKHVPKKESVTLVTQLHA